MAKVLEFTAERGVSVEVKGVWHKFSAGIKIGIEPGDDTSEVKDKAWDTVAVEIDRQIDEVLKENGIK